MHRFGSSLGITLSLLSSISQAFVIKFDEIMMSDCYENKPRVAWFISICGGILFGFLTTALLWLLHHFFYGQIGTIYAQSISLAIEGFWMFWVGVFSMSVLGAYFYLFIPTDNKTSDITTISMWLASTPIWVYLVSIFIINSDVHLWPFKNLQLEYVSLPVILLAVTSILFIVWYDNSNKDGSLTSQHLLAVLVMIVLITLYVIIASAVLYKRDLIDVLALQPYYWFGFSTGLLLIISKGVRRELVDFGANFKKYYKLILFAEIVGAFVFIFELYALWQLSGVLVNLISSGHVVVLFFITLVLTRIGYRMRENNSRITIGSVQIQANQLIAINLTTSRVLIFTIVSTVLAITITLMG